MRYFSFVLCAGLTLMPFPAMGRAYYVAKVDTLNADGSSAHPFPRIQQAAAVMVAGDSCLVRQGVYRETVRPTNSGSSGKPLVFLRYQNDSVMIHGGEVVTGAWTKDSGNIYSIAYSGTVRDLFVNRQYMLQARHPNMPYDSARGGFAMLMAQDNTLNPPANVDWTGVYLIRFNSVNQIFQQNAYSLEVNGILIGPRGLLDSEGEWSYKNNRLSLWAPRGRNPGTLLVETLSRDYGFNLQQRNYIIVGGITFFGTSLNLDQAANCIIDNCRVLYHCPLFLSTGNASGWNRESGANASVNGKGVTVGGSANIIRNCEIAHSWGDGVTMYGTGNTIENCHIYDCSWAGTDCAAICTGGSGHFIRNNTVHDCSRSVLLHRKTGGTIIEHNDLYGAGWLQSDLGVTYTFATDGQGTEIRYNLVHECYSSLGGAGVYIDNGCSNFIVHHNAIFSFQNAWKFFGFGFNAPQTGNRHYNNTLDNVNYNSITIGATGWRDCKFVNNIIQRAIVNASPSQVTCENNFEDSVTAPRFVDPDAGDLQLLPASPCIDKGKVIAPYTDGYAGSAPDQGAYEYGKPAWSAGSSLARKNWGTVRVPGRLSRRGWRTYASVNGVWTGFATDGRLDTWWDSYSPFPAAGARYFMVNMQKPQMFNKIILCSAACPDQTVKSYEVYVSNDGLAYGSPIAAGTGSGGIMTIGFPAQNAQYVKITNPNSAAGQRWAIEEIFLAYDALPAAAHAHGMHACAQTPENVRIYSANGSLVGTTGGSAGDLLLKPGLYVARAHGVDGSLTYRRMMIMRTRRISWEDLNRNGGQDRQDHRIPGDPGRL
jgi:hypothetical protein